MVGLEQFQTFITRVNNSNHIPTDDEIRIFFAKNSKALPHFDIQMIEVISGSGYLESKIVKEMTEVLNKKEYLILKTLHEKNQFIKATKGKTIILPHPFYIAQPDENTKLVLRHKASTEL